MRCSLFILPALISLHAAAQLSPGIWHTDLSKHSVPISELAQGGPPKDGIPSIDSPKYVDAANAAQWLGPKEPVLVVEHGNEVRAYPLEILVWHELVNDRLEDLSILVSYCPLCNSAVVFDRRVDGNVYSFGVSGIVRQSNMIMYDRQTESLWQQITGEAIVGRMTGSALRIVNSQTVSFEDFARAFPNGKVLSRQTGYDRPYGQNPYAGYEPGNRPIMPVRLPKQLRKAPLQRIIVVQDNGKSKAWPFPVLRERGVVEDHLGSLEFVVFYQEGTLSILDRKRIAASRDAGSAAAFSPYIEGKRLNFVSKNGAIVDRQTNSTWNLFGVATRGHLAGKRLTPVAHGVYFAFAWLIFHPDTELVGQPAM